MHYSNSTTKQLEADCIYNLSLFQSLDINKKTRDEGIFADLPVCCHD